MKTQFKLLALTTALVVAGSASVAATGNGQDKLYVCHRTASESNPYVLIHIPDPAQLEAHLNGTAKGHFPTTVGDDYIPTQYEIENGCGAEPEPTPKPKPTPTPEPKPTPPPVPAPEPPVAGSKVRVRSCGDPRLLVTLSNTGEVRNTYRITVTTQNRGRVTLTRRVAANSTNVLAPIWFKGGSRVVIRVNGERVYAGRPKTSGWGKNACPVSLKAAKRDARRR